MLFASYYQQVHTDWQDITTDQEWDFTFMASVEINSDNYAGISEVTGLHLHRTPPRNENTSSLQFLLANCG